MALQCPAEHAAGWAGCHNSHGSSASTHFWAGAAWVGMAVWDHHGCSPVCKEPQAPALHAASWMMQGSCVVRVAIREVSQQGWPELQ